MTLLDNVRVQLSYRDSAVNNKLMCANHSTPTNKTNFLFKFLYIRLFNSSYDLVDHTAGYEQKCKKGAFPRAPHKPTHFIAWSYTR